MLKSQSPLLRGYSAWALSHLCDKDKEVVVEIKEALIEEKDEFAKEMMAKAINRLKG